MKHSLAVLALSLALFGSACTHQSAYHPEKDGIGFTEERVSETVYRIKLHGDKDTSQQTVENMLLLRMAELTKTDGMDHFTVVMDETICATKVRTSPTTTCTYERPVDATFPFLALAEDFSDIGPATREYEARAMFIMGPGRVTSDATHNYVAEDVIARLGHLKAAR